MMLNTESLSGRDILEDRQIVLAVTGSIAAYKACGLVTRLKRRGADVRVIMTENATRLVNPMTFAVLSDQPVQWNMWAERNDEGMSHLSLQEFAEAFVVCPATANIVAKAARGIADDLVSTAIMAADCPIAFAPAMNTRMYEGAAVEENIELLRDRGRWLIGPVTGRLASGATGTGRLAPVPQILATIEQMLTDQEPTEASLGGRKVVITGGPTREYLDPVRYLSNPSSGKMGYALAQQAVAAGAEAVLVAGPGDVSSADASGENLRIIDVVSADEMLTAVRENLSGADAFIGAAAVADYQPAQRYTEKMKKAEGDLELPLQRTPDIIDTVSHHEQRPQVVVGFAAESADIEANARSKLQEKNLDLIAANSVVEDASGFGADTNRVTLLGPDQFRRELPLMSKWAVGGVIMEYIGQRLE